MSFFGSQRSCVSALSHFLGWCTACPMGTSRLPAPCHPSPGKVSINRSSQVHSVALSERDLQREIRIQLAQLPKSSPGPAPLPQARLPGAQAIFESQQLAGVRGSTKPEIPRIVVQPPEEPRPPRRKPQTRGKTFHGLLTRVRGPPIEGPSRSHRGSASFLDTRF